MNKSIHYKGRYKGVSYLIVEWCFDTKTHWEKCWNYYLLLNLNQFKDQEFIKQLEDLPWHGDCTYNRMCKEGTEYIKVGCDYQHSFDRGRHYTPELILVEVKETIDALHERTTYLIKENGEGKLIEYKDGVDDGEYFWSKHFVETTTICTGLKARLIKEGKYNP